MKLWRAVGPVAITFGLGAAGLFLPGGAGDVASFVWLGVFPGLAVVRLFLPGTSAGTRWTLGVALAPLATAVIGWALLLAGHPLPTAARLIALGGWFLFAGGEARGFVARGTPADDAPGERRIWAWAMAAAAFVALPMLVSPWALVRSDSWVHAGIVWEIAERGVPPQDPRFAGLPLNYVWFYNLFIALLGGLRPGSSPFTHMATANACWIAALTAIGGQLAWSVWRDRAAVRAAAPLLLTGLNAGAVLLWPLWLLRAARGEVRGLPEVHRIVDHMRWDGVEVMHQLSAPFAWMVNSWDKYMVGTALGHAYLLMLVSLWAGARWLSDTRDERPAGTPAPWRWLLVAFAAAAGMMLFHSVVGLSAIPVGIGASLLLAALATREPRLGPPRRALVLAAVLAAGLAVAWPYFRSIVSGWDAGRTGVTHSYLRLDWRMPWTLATACGVALLAAWPGIVRIRRERSVAGTWLVCWLLGMTAFASVVHLPEHNEFKFVWMVFAPLAVLGSAGFPALLAAWRRRLGRPLASVWIALAFVLPTVLVQAGFLADRSGASAPEVVRTSGDAACYAWVREHTPLNAVFTDDRSRDALLVEGRRRLLAGTPHGPERAAFPAAELAHRRAVMADLYGPVADLAADAACLDSLGAPAYVLYRDEDAAALPRPPWLALDADPERFERVYAADGRRIYRRRM